MDVGSEACDNLFSPPFFSRTSAIFKQRFKNVFCFFLNDQLR